MDESTPLSNHYAMYDSLTGALTRRAFLEEAVSEFRKYQRYQHPFAFLIIEIDHFQNYAERFNDAQRDHAFRQLTITIAQLLREQDLIGRLGRDEFGVLLLETDEERAGKIAERLRQNCAVLGLNPLSPGSSNEIMGTQETITGGGDEQETESFERHSIPAPTLTISIGISTPQAEDHSFEQVFTRADQALTFAKQNGGNCVEIWH